ncbi:MAG: response regulator [Pseudobacteriovorax sp.]|nr:response regulator [Pseudobacteriovorax sp.]
MKILVVEDSPSIRTVIKYIVENEGWDLTEAVSHEEASTVFDRAKEFDLVIVDHGSQKLDGLEVLRQLQNIGYQGKSIVISLDDRERFIEEAKGLGISGWLHKPFTNEHFCRAVDHAMGEALLGKKTA